MNDVNLFGNSKLSNLQAESAWTGLSETYAKQAKGDAHVFPDAPFRDAAKTQERVYTSTEFPSITGGQPGLANVKLQPQRINSENSKVALEINQTSRPMVPPEFRLNRNTNVNRIIEHAQDGKQTTTFVNPLHTERTGEKRVFKEFSEISGMQPDSIKDYYSHERRPHVTEAIRERPIQQGGNMMYESYISSTERPPRPGSAPALPARPEAKAPESPEPAAGPSASKRQKTE